VSESVLDKSMSLDGYISDPNDFLGGEDGERLHDWFASGGESVQPSGPSREFEDEWNAAGAVSRDGGLPSSWITGPVTITVSRSSCPVIGPPAARWGYPLVTYVTDGIESAMQQAKAAAGDRNVQVRGAYTGQRALEAGVLDEVQIHQVPVLLDGGRRLFDVLPSQIEFGDPPGDRHA
jgi:hypothetical protein